MSFPPSKSSGYIPVVSDLVRPGNPQLKKQSGSSDNHSYINALNDRIEELESAIGQDAIGSQSRAYAIRQEASRCNIPPAKKIKGGKTPREDDFKALS
ncbi:MAG: hypothetical protein CSB47_02250 [Proteobacteria bacterium]|nr:MAG: hypothetical protein CSB47_02250 [Pseudomonadota bacterium]